MRTTFGCILLLLLLAAHPARAEAYESAATTPEGVDRELLVRFSRAYGMAAGAFEQHADESASGDELKEQLKEPDELEDPLQEEVYRILDLNGLDKEEWQMMFAQMEENDDLRRRVDSLAVPFQQH